VSRGFRNAQRYIVQVGEEEKESPWVSFTDLMSAFLIIFALVLMITLFLMQQNHEASAAEIEQERQLREERDQVIDDLVGIKSRIIQALVKEFDGELQIDQVTGAITFPGGVFFDYDSNKVSSSGSQYMAEFIPKYVSILLSDQFKDEISQIIVEGHTDGQGSYLYNLNLSQERALSVIQTIFSEEFPNFGNKEAFGRMITANGRSFSDPVVANGVVDAEKSRRVVFKFRLKEEQMLDKIQSLLNEQPVP